MIDWFQIFVLAVIQGLTEFLPISSSAHLILVPILTGWVDQGISFDIAVHFGTLIAVALYFQKEIRAMSYDSFQTMKGHEPTAASKQAFFIICATIPVCIVGFLAHDIIAEHLRSPRVIAWATIFFGFLLLLSDKLQTNRMTQVGFNKAMVMGCAQVLALIPGTSRSGITLTAGLSMGLTRHVAARFSFLMAIPVIFIAMSYEILKLMKSNESVAWVGLGTSAFFSFLFALLSIHFFLKLIDQLGMTPFVIYRFLLGGLLLYLF